MRTQAQTGHDTTWHVRVLRAALGALVALIAIVGVNALTIQPTFALGALPMDHYNPFEPLAYEDDDMYVGTAANKVRILYLSLIHI